jgi:hypothetical protein
MSNGQKVRKITIRPLSDRGTSLPPSTVAATSMETFGFGFWAAAASDTYRRKTGCAWVGVRVGGDV